MVKTVTNINVKIIINSANLAKTIHPQIMLLEFVKNFLDFLFIVLLISLKIYFLSAK